MTMPTRVLIACLLWNSAACAMAQPPAPPPPAKYRATLRYYIPSPRDQHVVQYDSLIRHLQRLAFEFDPPLEKHLDTDREDRTKNYLRGLVTSANARKLLDHPVVQTILLEPENFDLPKDPDDPVSVRLDLSGNLTPDRQRELANQTRVLLRELGFKEAPGYDHRGFSGRFYTRIVGTIPRSKLDLLQRDLRSHPAGWLGPIIPRDEVPSPLREVNPVRIIEVLPDTEAIKELATPEPRTPEYLEKISPDLWELVKDKELPRTPIRIQIVFVGNVNPDDLGWKATLSEAAPGFFVEGQLGQFVTGVLRLDQVKALAASPQISVLRLPRAPAVDVDPTVKIKGDNAKALAQTGLRVFHDRGFQGKAVRIGIIDRDFRGWETLVKKKQLPPRTRLVDLTTERDPEVYPLPYPGDPAQIGHGTLCAQAAALAAPEAEMVLIRIDVSEPNHLHEVARYVQAGRFSNVVEQRSGELIAYAAKLSARRGDLLRERRIILNDFTDETDLRDNLEFLGPLFAWIYSDREWHRKRMEHHEKLEEEHRLREERFRLFLKDINSLENIPIVVNALAFNSGYPLGAISPLSRALDDPHKGPLWFQAVGNVRGQAWLGRFRSIPGDPAMKFIDDTAPLLKDRWSTEVNFLAWQSYQGEQKPDLPEKIKLRFTLQWREAHDPEYYLRSDEDDFYRRPLANLRLQLLRQRDPQHKTLPADLFENVARTAGWPERLEHLPSGSVYEQVLEVPLEKGGRFAIRVEKQVSTQWLMAPHPIRLTPTFIRLDNLTPTGIRPLGAPTLPALEKQSDLRPRIFVEVIDEMGRTQGRAVFADFSTEAGAIGIPADARNVISVGSASLRDRPQPYSAFGSPPLMELARRPAVYAYDELELAAGGAFGTSIANAFAAGTTATLMSAGANRAQVLHWLRSHDGQVLRVPVAKK